jgi:4'-phosphopantetheinyl transferase
MSREVDMGLTIWEVSRDSVDTEWLEELAEEISTDEELARCARLLREEDGQICRLTRVSSRVLLARELDTVPSSIDFAVAEGGKPYLRDHGGDLKFNLSHSGDRVVCAIVYGREIGVDIEHLERRCNREQVASRSFAPREHEALARISDEQRARRLFFAYWTLKEAYIKARGLGLAIPLDQVEFSFVDALPARPGDRLGPSSIDLRLGADIEDRPECWSFELRALDSRYLLATCWQGDANITTELRSFSFDVK